MHTCQCSQIQTDGKTAFSAAVLGGTFKQSQRVMANQSLLLLPKYKALFVRWKHTANCIIIAPKRLKIRLSGSARKSQKRFRDTPRFKFQAVLARTQPFLSRSEEKRGDQSRFKCRKLSIIMQFAVPDWSALPSKTRSKLYRQNVRSKPVVRRSKLNSACLSSSESPLLYLQVYYADCSGCGRIALPLPYLNARMPLDGSAHQTSASELESTPG